MEEEVSTQSKIKIFRKIREEIEKALKDRGMKIGDDYSLSSATNEPTFTLTVNKAKKEVRTNVAEINKILSEKFKEKISILLSDGKTLLLNISEGYFEEVTLRQEEIANSSNGVIIFLNNLKEFIYKVMGDRENGFSFEIKRNECVEIKCTDFLIFLKIQKELKSDQYYQVRLDREAITKTIFVYLNAIKDKEVPKKEDVPPKNDEVINKTKAPPNIVKLPEVKHPLNEPGLVVTEKKDFESKAYVHSSMNYDEFCFLSFNRKRKKRHVNKIVESIKKFGVLSFVTVVYTDCIDGVMRKYIVDGQHRFDAFVMLKLPILYVVAKANSVEELVRLIAELNRTSRNWVLRDYLKAWSSLSEQYRIMEKCLNKTRLPFTLLLEIYSGYSREAATKMFQNGGFSIKDKESSERLIEWIVEMRNSKLLPKSREILSAFVAFINKTKDYDNGRMRIGLGKISKNYFIPGETNEDIVKKFRILYAS